MGFADRWPFWRRRDEPKVSMAWRLEHERQQAGKGIDGVSWRWPVRKLMNEASLFNSRRLRKRA